MENMELNEEAEVGSMITVSFTVFIVKTGMLSKIHRYAPRVHYGFLNEEDMYNNRGDALISVKGLLRQDPSKLFFRTAM